MKKTTILAAALVVLAMQAQGQDEAQRFVTGNGLSQAAEEFGCVVPSRSRRPCRALCSPVPYVDRPAPITACYARVPRRRDDWHAVLTRSLSLALGRERDSAVSLSAPCDPEAMTWPWPPRYHVRGVAAV